MSIVSPLTSIAVADVSSETAAKARAAGQYVATVPGMGTLVAPAQFTKPMLDSIAFLGIGALAALVLNLMPMIGVEALAFGSHLPFDYVAPSLVKLDSVARFHAPHHEAIAWRNAARFLRLE